MSVVVPLRKTDEPQKEYCWQCGCGSQTFILLADGQIVCAECDHIHSRLRTFDTHAKPQGEGA